MSSPNASSRWPKCASARASRAGAEEARRDTMPGGGGALAAVHSGQDQAAAGHYHRAALLQPGLAHCVQPPEHHHRPASCHGELLLRPLERVSRWHTLAICCSRSASSSPHSCQGAVTAHLLAGLSRAGSPAGATRRPLSLVHHGPRRLLAVGARRQCAGTVEPEHRVLDASGVKSDLMWHNMQQ